MDPLNIISDANRRLGQLADSYTAVLRALTICEKHHSEEGKKTCQLRSQTGWGCLLSFLFLFPSGYLL